MNRETLIELLEGVRGEKVSIDDALAKLSSLPFEDLGFARVDHHRALRHGGPEVVFCLGKSAQQVVGIVRSLRERGTVLATRATPEHWAAVQAEFPELVYYERARIIGPPELGDAERGTGSVIVVSAGTADLPVAEEALLTARATGSRAEGLFDVGVAGLHRLLAEIGRASSAGWSGAR